MGNTFFFAWEPELMIWLQSHLGDFGLGLMSFFSLFGEELLLVLVMGFCYWAYDKELGKAIGRNVCVVSMGFPLIKNVALRLRPYMVCPGVKCLKPVDPAADIMDLAAQGYSFPSGHSSGSVAAYGSLALYEKHKWVKVLGVALPLLVGISRFCVGVHFPTDVLAGWALGLVVVWLLPRVQGLFSRRWVFYGVILLLALPGWFYCQTDDYYTSFGMAAGFFAADLFEERFVRFTGTRTPWKMAVRVLGGVGIYLGLNTLCKLPFSPAFLASGSFPAHLIRTLRYGLILFVDVGLYPLAFQKLKI